MTLDPKTGGEWLDERQRLHEVLDECIASMQNMNQNHPVWRQPSNRVVRRIGARMDVDDLASTLTDALDRDSGNRHPMFFGYAQGGGTLAAFMADMVASAANANCGGRVHHAMDVEREVVRWSLELFGMPEGSGVLTCGTSEAHVLAARVVGPRRTLASRAAHESVARAFGDVTRVPTNDGGGMSPVDCAHALEQGESAAIVVTLGTTLNGAVDDVTEIVNRVTWGGRTTKPWIHLDAALGAHWLVDPPMRARYAAWLPFVDSVAFDFHKGFQVQYDCGAFLCRDAERHLATFAHDAPYLRRDRGGITSDGRAWPADLGIALSRQNRALRAWATLQAYGTDAFALLALRQEAMGRLLRTLLQLTEQWRIISENHGIVVFRLRNRPLERESWHAEIARRLQVSGEAVVTAVDAGNGCMALRACILNHRTEERHVEHLVKLLQRELLALETHRDRQEEPAA